MVIPNEREGIDLVESKAEPGGSPARSHIFLVSRRTFQTPFNKSAPMNKITNAIAYPTTVDPDDAGYRQPARANTIFPFRFILPSDAGTAVECGQEVRTRYTLTGYAKVRILGSFETLIDSVEVISLNMWVNVRLMLLNNYPMIISIGIRIINLMK
jgi:hypothetical protein